MSNESQVQTEEKSSPSIWKIILIILGALAVFALVLFIGRALVGDSGVSGPEVVPPPPDTSGPSTLYQMRRQEVERPDGFLRNRGEQQDPPWKAAHPPGFHVPPLP